MKRTLLLLFFSASLLFFLAACSQGESGTSRRPPKGNPNAAVIITEYADLQCPACRASQGAITNPIIEKYGNQIRFDFKHFPLRSIHRFALDAGVASECAADQGKFWEYVDLVFAQQDSLSSNAFPAWARQLGLDVDVFNKCMKSRAKRDLVLADYKEGRELGVGGTPTYFVNGKRVETGFDTISEAIDAELERLTQHL